MLAAILSFLAAGVVAAAIQFAVKIRPTRVAAEVVGEGVLLRHDCCYENTEGEHMLVTHLYLSQQKVLTCSGRLKVPAKSGTYVRILRRGEKCEVVASE